METNLDLFIFASLSTLLLLISWIVFYGLKLGAIAFVLRLCWMMPLVAVFFPQSLSVSIPNTVDLKTLHVLVDDSESMQEAFRKDETNQLLTKLGKLCERFSCQLRITKLSELDPRVLDGYSPLADGLVSWMYAIKGEPWIFLTDGGDKKPTESWSSLLSQAGRDGQNNGVKGLILGFGDKSEQNLWTTLKEPIIFAFEDRPTTLHAEINRQVVGGDLPFQVQVLSGDVHLASMNGVFKDGDEKIEVEILLPPLTRGQSILRLKALPIAGEKQIWDNESSVYMDVLPNTVGLLHLLGSPSWDGRFIRRYLKSEPKFDLISFFILRDPVDLQLTNERELSLIPFPVERLFNQELNNFRSVIIQNFSLYKFLEPSYQANLVEFVKSGGGLLFIGGPRALHSIDLQNSPLSEIIPFELKGSANKSVNSEEFPAEILRDGIESFDRTGPFYDENLSFAIEMANPTSQQRSLARVYDEWLGLSSGLSKQDQLTGLHHMENVKFKKGEHTPLLNARLANGDTIPLAVASYPGKGRALWVFSDSFWQMGLNPKGGYSRQLYYDFVSSGLTWLLRQEIRKPLMIKDFAIREQSNGQMSFELSLSGPAAAYLDNGGTWRFQICGEDFALQDLLTERRSVDNWQIVGSLKQKLSGGDRCRVKAEAEYIAFGSVEASIDVVVPVNYRDVDINGSLVKLAQLSAVTGARLSVNPTDWYNALDDWLPAVTGSIGIATGEQIRTIDDYFWFLDRWWFWLICLAIPLEILVRRWPEISRSKA